MECKEDAVTAATAFLADGIQKTVAVIDERIGVKFHERSLLLRKELGDDTVKDVRGHIAEDLRKLVDSIDDTIDRRLRQSFVIAGIVLAALGAFGYFGLQASISQVILSHIDEKQFEGHIQKTRDQAAAQLESIRKLQEETSRRTSVIVLQTDFGMKSAYMGALIGSIYSSNPASRIAVITSEISDFDTLEAAWTLWRAAKHFPGNTIFLAITNPGGLTADPIVVRTKNGQLYLSYYNGVLDLVVQQFGFEAGFKLASPDITPASSADLFGAGDLFGPAAGKTQHWMGTE